MKIETADCVQAIVEYFEGKGGDLTDTKAWKRLSKTGSGNSIKRSFQNKKTGDVVYVMSTETEILSVSENDSIITKFDNFTSKPKKIKTLDKIKSMPEFIELNSNGNLDGKWETTTVDKEDSDLYTNLLDSCNDNEIEDFRHDLYVWGGWMCDDIEDYINKKLKIENHYLTGTDFIEINSISFGDKLLVWELHED